jgi:hypothetical protein
MSNQQQFKFVCVKCGSSKWVCRDYVLRSRMGTVADDGKIEAHPPIIDENDTTGAEGYRCADCDDIIVHCGRFIMTEDDWIAYLSMDPATRVQQQREWESQFPENDPDCVNMSDHFVFD